MKNPILAFLLAFFPGAGLLYLGKIRGLFYTFAVIASPFLFYFLYGMSGWWDIFIFLGFGFTILFYLINFIDTAVTASKLYGKSVSQNNPEQRTKSNEQERFFTIILSFVPGLGHLQLNLMNRGLTLLIAFIGLAGMIIFVTLLTGRGEFLIFSIFLLVIWIFGFFDAMKQLEKKQRGELLEDRSILEELEMRREDGKKSKSVATILSLFPGAGHLYLGYQKRGIQLMALFLFSIYVLDFLRLGLFLFLIPIIWFYSFFDGMQKASNYEQGEVNDVPIISYLINHQRWVGVGLILIGAYYLANNIIIPSLAPKLEAMWEIDIYYLFDRYFQTAIVSALFIFGGIKLLFSSRKVEEHGK
ncbi:hypothetical protein [Bacillus kwashiorkori]|uniref:hypothetical protein n=1 Tax=Bacillus kwashiorkori TaxID=1522318 RepID=UPI0007831FB6|nr:hypothetical protein [Bacillus kwashiorkori]